MKNLILAPHVRKKIDARVDRLLGDVGRPEPPLQIEVVRDWLKIDLGYFQREDAGLLARAVHKIRVGVVQSLARPMLIREAIQEFKLRALCAPDFKRILIDEQVPTIKHRWLEAHETVHQLLPCAYRASSERLGPYFSNPSGISRVRPSRSSFNIRNRMVS